MSEERAVSTALVSAPSGVPTQVKHGLRIKRLFTKPGFHPFDEVEWELRTAIIQNEKEPGNLRAAQR